MHRPTTFRPLEALSLDELLLSALYHHLIDGADHTGDRVSLWVGNQYLEVVPHEARDVLQAVLYRHPDLGALPETSASPN